MFKFWQGIVHIVKLSKPNGTTKSQRQVTREYSPIILTLNPLSEVEGIQYILLI